MRFRLLSIFVLALTALGALPLSLAQPPAALDGTQWQLISLDGSPVLDSTSVTLAFGPQDRAGGSGGCNSYGGSYSVQDDALSFGPLASTMMACHDDVMQQELDYFAALQAVTRFTRSGDQLILFYGEGQQLIFAHLATLANTRWQLESLDDAAPAGEAPLTLEFDAAGRVSGSSGCNRFSASYALEGDALRFGPIASTKMARLDEALMQQEMAYLAALEAVTHYEQSTESLVIFYGEEQRLIFVPLAE